MLNTEEPEIMDTEKFGTSVGSLLGEAPKRRLTKGDLEKLEIIYDAYLSSENAGNVSGIGLRLRSIRCHFALLRTLDYIISEDWQSEDEIIKQANQRKRVGKWLDYLAGKNVYECKEEGNKKYYRRAPSGNSL